MAESTGTLVAESTGTLVAESTGTLVADSVVECQICNWEVAGSNLSPCYFVPRSTQPSSPLGLVNEYQLQLGRQM